MGPPTPGADHNGGPLPAIELMLLPRIRAGIARQLVDRPEPQLLPVDRAWIESLVTGEIEAYHAAAPHRRQPVLDAPDYDRLHRRLMAQVAPLGPLAELLADPLVEEVIVNGPDEILLVRDGAQVEAGLRFPDEEALLTTVQHLLGAGASHLDRANPMVTASLSDGSRLNAVLPPVALPMAITVRRHQLSRFAKLSDLAVAGALPWELLPLLQTAVRARLSVIVSGSTGSGKTTMLRLLIGEIPDWERVITIEDQRELHVRTADGGRSNSISLEARDANTEGSGEISIQQLVRNALRQRPDRIFVGECRGAEALDVIDAMGTGHDGSGTTLHANSSRDALLRLAALVRRHPAQGRADPVSIARELAAKVDLVIHLSRFRRSDGSDVRVVQSVGFITGQVEGEIPVLEEVCRYRLSRGDWEWRLFRLDDMAPKIADKFAGAGIDVEQLWRPGSRADGSLGTTG